MSPSIALDDLLVRLDTYIRELHEFDGMKRIDYLSNGMAQDALERRLQLATEVCLDIAEAVISTLSARAARDYVDLFRALGEESVLAAEQAEEMQGIARYRNRLVYDYDSLDPERVFAFRKSHLKDFERYAASIRAFQTQDQAEPC